MKLIIAFAVAVALVLVVQPAWAQDADIVFLGDDARLGLLERCGARCKGGSSKVGSPPRGSTASAVATFSQRAKHGVIVVDAASGPLPITREHVLIARQAGVPSLSIMLANTAALAGMGDARELIELEVLEVRELLNKYEMGGDKASVFYDGGIRTTPPLAAKGIGINAALDYAASLPPRTPFRGKLQSGRRIESFVYLLSPQESPYAASLHEGSVIRMWIHGQVVGARVTSAKPFAGGGNLDLSVETDATVTMPEAVRFLIEREGRIIGAGLALRVESGLRAR